MRKDEFLTFLLGDSEFISEFLGCNLKKAFYEYLKVCARLKWSLFRI